MTPERAKELLPVIEAFAVGKIVQAKSVQGNWHDIDKPQFDDNTVYRVKPTPREMWFNLYADGSESGPMPSEKSAIDERQDGFLRTIHLVEVEK